MFNKLTYLLIMAAPLQMTDVYRSTTLCVNLAFARSTPVPDLAAASNSAIPNVPYTEYRARLLS